MVHCLLDNWMTKRAAPLSANESSCVPPRDRSSAHFFLPFSPLILYICHSHFPILGAVLLSWPPKWATVTRPHLFLHFFFKTTPIADSHHYIIATQPLRMPAKGGCAPPKRRLNLVYISHQQLRDHVHASRADSSSERAGQEKPHASKSASACLVKLLKHVLTTEYNQYCLGHCHNAIRCTSG